MDVVDVTVVIVLDDPAGEIHGRIRLRSQCHRIGTYINMLEVDGSGLILDDVLVGLVSRLALDQFHVGMIIVDFIDSVPVGAIPCEGEH